MEFFKTGFVLAASATLLLSGCTTVPSSEWPSSMGQKFPINPATPIILPAGFTNPDCVTLGNDGNIYLTINNSSDPAKPPKIAYIDASDKIHVFCDLPTHPVSGKTSPLGIDFGPDGHLYVADNQTFVSSVPNTSRLLRVNIKNGKPIGTDVVVTGLNAANGVSAFGEYVAVNDTCIDATYPQQSGTYRFRLDELKGAPIRVGGLTDSNLIIKFPTMNKEYQVGANGLAYDHDGHLFVCNFGDKEILKATFKSSGELDTLTVFAKGQGLESADGIQVDEYGTLWVADFIGNACACVCPKSGEVTIVAKNKPGTGQDGGLDAPAECVRRGNKLYGSNIDLTYGPNTADNVHTISVYELN